MDDVRHVKVFHQPGRFAGWPANNGIWQWGNEILVGFSLGYLAPPGKQGLHQIDPDRPRPKASYSAFRRTSISTRRGSH